MNYIMLGYLYFILENKVKCRYNIQLLTLGNIGIYNLKFVVKATKQSYINYINLIIQAARLYVNIYIND